MQQCSVPKVKSEFSDNNKQATATRYKEVRDELNETEAQVQYAHAAPIPSVTCVFCGGLGLVMLSVTL